MTQGERILEALREHPGGMTLMELVRHTGIPGCSKRISELREDEWEIPDVLIDGKNYGRYVLRGKKCNQSQKNSHPNTCCAIPAKEGLGLNSKTEGSILTVPNAGGPLIENHTGETGMLFFSDKEQGNAHQNPDPGGNISGGKKEFKETRYRLYVCERGHREPFYGEPEPKVKCSQCNYQAWATLVDRT